MRLIALAVLLWGICDCDAAELTTIPIATVVTTSRQTNMQHVKVALAAPGSDPVANARAIKNLAAILKLHGGSSNAFLAHSDTVADAIGASSNVIIHSHSAQKPASLNGEHAGRGSYWLVATLGVSSGSPPRWVVGGVTVSDNTIRLSYRLPKAGIRTSDMLSYYYWVPLGKLESGAYAIELFDADADAVTLMRRVVVNAPE